MGSVIGDASLEGGGECPSKHATGNGSKPLGLIWIDCPYLVAAVSLAKTFENEARVPVGREVPTEEILSFIILGPGGAEGLSDGVKRVREANSEGLILVFGLHLDLSLVWAALQMGKYGFIYAGMMPDQVLRAVKVAAAGEIIAPRWRLEYTVAGKELDTLSHRQREVLDLVA